MDKISSILPSSPRVKAVDTEKSQPARPGAPRFGRPEGKNSLGEVQEAMAAQAAANAALNAEDKLSFSAKAVDASAGKVAADKYANQAATEKLSEKVYDRTAVAKKSAEKTSDSARAQVAKDLAAKFFMESPKSVARQNSLVKSEQATEDLADNFAAANALKANVDVVRNSAPKQALEPLSNLDNMAFEKAAMEEMSPS